MADPKRHWKESIGVMPGVTPKKSTTGAHPTAGSQSTTTASGIVLPTLKPPPARTTGQRETISVAHTEESILAPIENLIDSLPSGSITFADQVQQKLWHRPTPIEIRALGVIAAEKVLAPPAVRKLTVRVVAVRQRIGHLLYTPLVTIDSERIAAIGGEWVRLANLVREMRRTWPTAPAEGAEERVLRAAYELLAEPFDLEVKATLSAEMSRLVDAIRNGNASGTPVWNAPVAEVDDLMAAISRGTLAADQGLCLELFAGCTLAQRHANEQERGALERDRRLLELLAEQLEARVDVMLQAHTRDPASVRRLGAWKRYLTETRSRVNESLTRPAAPATEPATHGQASEVHITAPQGLSDGDTQVVQPTAPVAPATSERAADAATEAHEETIVEHLRSVRSSLPALPEEAKPAPQQTRWVACLAGAVLVAIMGLWTARLPALLPAPDPVSLEQFESALPLTQAARAGALMVATADPTWKSLSSSEQQLGATRLMTIAEELGCSAGLLLNAEGTPLAVWSPGREPLLRRALHRSETLSLLFVPDQDSRRLGIERSSTAR